MLGRNKINTGRSGTVSLGHVGPFLKLGEPSHVIIAHCFRPIAPTAHFRKYLYFYDKIEISILLSIIFYQVKCFGIMNR